MKKQMAFLAATLLMTMMSSAAHASLGGAANPSDDFALNEQRAAADRVAHGSKCPLDRAAAGSLVDPPKAQPKEIVSDARNQSTPAVH